MKKLFPFALVLLSVSATNAFAAAEYSCKFVEDETTFDFHVKETDGDATATVTISDASETDADTSSATITRYTMDALYDEHTRVARMLIAATEVASESVAEVVRIDIGRGGFLVLLDSSGKRLGAGALMPNGGYDVKIVPCQK